MSGPAPNEPATPDMQAQVARLTKIVQQLSDQVGLNAPGGRASGGVAVNGRRLPEKGQQKATSKPAGASQSKPQEIDPEQDPSFTPIAWTVRASTEDWQKLVEWVDWLRGTYDLREEFTINPCWPAHLGIANELAALRSSWIGALYAEQEKKDKAAMIHWHDRWLHPFLARLRLSNMGRACEVEHQKIRIPGPTDSSLIPSPGEYVTAAAPTPAGPDGGPAT